MANPAEGKFSKCACPKCGQHIEYPAVLANDTGTCPTCRWTFVLPTNLFWPGILRYDRQEQWLENKRRNWKAGYEPEALADYPAWEAAFDPIEKIDWLARWNKANGPSIAIPRMIALKTDSVWASLGNPNLFPDALGNPYPPYVNGSILCLLDIDRRECQTLGFTQLPPYIPWDFKADFGVETREQMIALRDNIEEALRSLNERKL